MKNRRLSYLIGRFFLLLKKEVVLSAAFVLAVLSSFFVLPDKKYIDYIDFKVLALLFGLMTVVAGLKKLGILDYIAEKLIATASSLRGITIILVSVCFFSSMIITNDVALITFVPFAIIILNKAGFKEKIIFVVIMQTIAANLGSMLTPIGNPQNLYIYSSYNMSIEEFFKIMFPYTLVSFVLIMIVCVLFTSDKKEVTASNTEETVKQLHKKTFETIQLVQLGFYIILFIISIFTVLRIIHYSIPAIVAFAGCMILDRKILKSIDYGLLLTFICFFIFIGNMGRIDAICTMLSRIIEGRELITAFLSSQIISNVPATILLSGFTQNYASLLAGVNIGGLGTLIASLASLISYKFVAAECPDKKGMYILKFTMINLAFAVILFILSTFLQMSDKALY